MPTEYNQSRCRTCTDQTEFDLHYFVERYDPEAIATVLVKMAQEGISKRSTSEKLFEVVGKTDYAFRFGGSWG